MVLYQASKEEPARHQEETPKAMAVNAETIAIVDRDNATQDLASLRVRVLH